MELEIGMYVRTKNGKIWTINSQQAISGHRKDIVKASYNIFDLLEVGDIVNYTFWKEPDDFTIFCEMIRDIEQLLDFKFDIEENNITLNSILTKEQFKGNCYKVGD